VIRTILTWFAFWECAGLAGLPLARALLPRHADAGYGCGRVLFILFFTFGVFLTCSLGITERSRGALVVLAAGLIAVSTIVAVRSRTELINDIRARAANIAVSEAVFAGAFVLFLIPLLYTDTSRFGERAMDLAFLTKLSFGGSLPPENPYLSGEPLRYYYYGHLIYASVTRLLGLDPSDSYLLATATSAALTVAATASLLSRLVPWRAGRFAGLFFTCFAMNLAYVRHWISGRRGDAFLSSNWMVGKAIDEAPIYTFLIAEMHAHALVMPACITALGLALALNDRRQGKLAPARTLATFVALACVLGSLGPTNVWSLISFSVACLAILAGSALQPARSLAGREDFASSPSSGTIDKRGGAPFDTPPTEGGYSGRTGLTWICKALLRLSRVGPVSSGAVSRDGPRKSTASSGRDQLSGSDSPRASVTMRAAGVGLMLIGAALLLYVPYYAAAGPVAAAPKLVRAHTSQPLGFALHWGLFFWIVLGWALSRPLRRAASSALVRWTITLVAVALLALQLSVVERLVQILPLGLALLAGTGASIFAAESRDDDDHFFSWLLAATGFLLIAGCEIVYINHALSGDSERGNTVFRLYSDAWLLLGVGTAYPVAVLFREAVRRRGRARAVCAAWAAVLVTVALVGLRYTAAGLWNKVQHFRSGPHLSAVHFMDTKDRGYADTMRWLSTWARAESRRPVVVEAVDADRETNWLGVPTPARAYVAWLDKLVEWNYSVHEVRPRLEIVQRLYQLPDPADTCALMKAEGVELIFFGAKERQHLGVPAREKFLRPPFRQVFTSGESALFTCDPGWQ